MLIQSKGKDKQRERKRERDHVGVLFNEWILTA
jgi:hypothetical protein